MSYLSLKYLCLFAHYLRYLCLFTYCVVVLFCFSSSCVPMLPVSLDCSFVIPTSVFYNVYLKYAEIYILVYCLPTYECVLKSN